MFFKLGCVRSRSLLTRDGFSMEQENKAESMRRWRKEQKEKKNAIKKAHYEKNRKKLIQKAVERKHTMHYGLWVKIKIADLAKKLLII